MSNEASGTRHIGVKLPCWGPLASFDVLRDAARAAEACGFGSVWASDHIVMPHQPESRYPFSLDGKPPFDPRQPFQDPLIALAWAGAVTERVQLGTSVLVLPMREPLLVAKQVATLDSLSAGRVVLGIGTGWMREEFELLGQRFEDRGLRTDQAVELLRSCWGQDEIVLGGFRARHDPVAMEPKPAQGAGVPIFVGGHSVAARRRAARIGDGWYASSIDAVDLEPLLAEARAERVRQQPGRPMLMGVKAPVAPVTEAARLVDELLAVGADVVVADLDYPAMDADQAVDSIQQLAAQLRLEDRDLGPIVAIHSEET